MNRYDFQKLANVRLKDARILRRNGRYEGCYYLCGYVVECALKTCVAKLTKRYDFPDKALLSKERGVYTHDLMQLLKLAKLDTELDTEVGRIRQFETNCLVVKKWSEQSRYDVPDREKAEEMFEAVANRKDRVFRWIRQHW